MILGEFPGYTVKTVYPGYFPHNPRSLKMYATIYQADQSVRFFSTEELEAIGFPNAESRVTVTDTVTGMSRIIICDNVQAAAIFALALAGDDIQADAGAELYDSVKHLFDNCPNNLRPIP
jgi:hypothetical protein